jgi:hypothetical protein
MESHEQIDHRQRRQRMAGYVKIPMDAVRAIHTYAKKAKRGPQEALELLTGYLTLRRFECDGPARHGAKQGERGFVASGARAIREADGKLSDHRSKQVLQALLKPPAALAEQPFILPTGCMRRNAAYYEFTAWGEELAYLPDTLWNKDARGDTALRAVLRANASPQRRLDALYLLVTLYARVDYDWLGVPPDRLIYQQALSAGTYELLHSDYSLGPRAEVGDYRLWLVRIDSTDDWEIAADVCVELFGDPSASQRLLAAKELLLDLSLVCKVLVVNSAEFCYPIWVSLEREAQSLWDQGIRTDLAERCQHRAAELRDPAARAIPGELAYNPGTKTGLFYCLSADEPEAYLLLMPRLHAPTPQNQSAMQAMADNTARIEALLALPGRACDENDLTLGEDDLLPF